MRRRNKKTKDSLWRFAVLSIAIVCVALAQSAAAQHPVPPTPAQDYLPGQVVVKYGRAGAVPQLLAKTSRWQAQILGHIPQLGVVLLGVPVGAEKSVAAQLQVDPLVQHVGFNYRAHILEEPNDPLWLQQWALPKIGAPDAWGITHGRGTIIAMLDTGVYLGHPDLRNVLWTNPGEMPGNGMDDDDNGKVDDIHGWHFFHQWDGSSYVPYENPIVTDENGHGTHITGIAAAETDNATGIAGLSWGARAMIVKVLDRQGEGWYWDVAQGIVYAADNGAQVINLSLGGAEPDPVLQDAVNYAYQRGVLLVAASGNDGGRVLYPAACENVMAVAATDSNDQRPGFSNYGPEVDIAAPGESIISTWLQSYSYYYKRGTSMAAAHVSGAAALLWSWRPDLTNAQIEYRLEMHADDVNAGTHPGHDPYLGWGRLNVYRALTGPDPPLTPTPTASPTPTATSEPTSTPTETPTATMAPQPTNRTYYLPLIYKNYRPL